MLWPDVFLTSSGKGRELGQGKNICSATAKPEILRPNSIEGSMQSHRWRDVVGLPHSERTLVLLKLDLCFFKTIISNWEFQTCLVSFIIVSRMHS